MTAHRGSGQVRIIGGSLRGSRLLVPARPGLRPTPARVRETLFNWLQPVLPGAHVLDLFAGSGALGLEALSRGCATAVFVERDRGLCEALRSNLERLQQSSAEVVHADAMSHLDIAPNTFDVVFMDPPFAADLWADAADRLETGGWLTRDAWIYVEQPPGARIALPGTWRMHRETRAGQVNAALYRRMPDDPLS